MRRNEQLWGICMDIYQELYKLAMPSLDFNSAVESGITAKENWFMAYYLSKERQNIVIQKHIKKNRLLGYEANKIRITIYLGCSPSVSKRATENMRHGRKIDE